MIGPKLVLETIDKVVLIKEKLKAARDRQKSYANMIHKPLEFEVGDQVLLKVLPWKGVVRFGKKGKLAARYVGPFEILERIRLVAYRLKLPEELRSVHDTFHVSNLKKCLVDANLHVPLDEIKTKSVGLLVGIYGLFSGKYCSLDRRVTCGYPWPGLKGNHRDKEIWLDAAESGDSLARQSQTKRWSSIKFNPFLYFDMLLLIISSDISVFGIVARPFDKISFSYPILWFRNPWSSLIPLSHGSFDVIVEMDYGLSKRKFVILRGTCPYLKIDFRSGYQQLRVHEDAIPKTAFLMRYRHFKSTVKLCIRCAPFEALYGRKCRSPVLWAEIGESSLIGLELVQEMTDKVVLVKKKPKAVRDRQKEGPFEILKRISLVSYRLRLSEDLNSVHETFHVSNLKKCLADANLHASLDEIKVDKTLRFVEEPVEIMGREIKRLKRRNIALVKVRWNSKRDPDNNKVNFHVFETGIPTNEMDDDQVSMSYVLEANARFENLSYGYFLGKKGCIPGSLAPTGRDGVSEIGLWMIRNVPIILKKKSSNCNLLKEEGNFVLVWVKLHDIPVTAFTEDGLSAMAIKLGKPVMLDAYTSSMCMQS
ncbi:putative reverse transcriptase domain-containing protein [Tanacetum coccineum]